MKKEPLLLPLVSSYDEMHEQRILDHMLSDTPIVGFDSGVDIFSAGLNRSMQDKMMDLRESKFFKESATAALMAPMIIGTGMINWNRIYPRGADLWPSLDRSLSAARVTYNNSPIENASIQLRTNKDIEQMLQSTQTQTEEFDTKVMKICWNGSLDYPVGKGMSEAMAFAKNAVRTFRSIKEYQFDVKEVGSIDIDIVCRGSSGAILAALFSLELELQHPTEYGIVVHHVKKTGEKSHTSNDLGTVREDAIMIVIDDFISSGETLNKMYSRLIEERDRREKWGSTGLNKKVPDVVILGGGMNKVDVLNFKPKYFLAAE